MFETPQANLWICFSPPRRHLQNVVKCLQNAVKMFTILKYNLTIFCEKYKKYKKLQNVYKSFAKNVHNFQNVKKFCKRNLSQTRVNIKWAYCFNGTELRLPTEFAILWQMNKFIKISCICLISHSLTNEQIYSNLMNNVWKSKPYIYYNMIIEICLLRYDDLYLKKINLKINLNIS